MDKPLEQELLTVEEARRILRIGRTNAWKLVQRGDIPSVRIGAKSVRVPAQALRDLISGDGRVRPLGRSAR